MSQVSSKKEKKWDAPAAEQLVLKALDHIAAVRPGYFGGELDDKLARALESQNLNNVEAVCAEISEAARRARIERAVGEGSRRAQEREQKKRKRRYRG